jgi:molecular chaperone DnaK
MCFELEKLMKEHDAKLRDTDREAMKKAVEKARSVMNTGDAEKIKAALSELEQASHAFSKVLYESAAARGAAGAGAGPQAAAGGASPGDDEAIDAEFEVKDN